MSSHANTDTCTHCPHLFIDHDEVTNQCHGCDTCATSSPKNIQHKFVPCACPVFARDAA